MTQNVLPRTRLADVAVSRAGDELLVVDLLNDEAHCLTGTPAMLWSLCNGSTTEAEAADQLDVTTDELHAAMATLAGLGLLQVDGLGRRALIQKGALVAGGVAAVTLLLPAASAAASTFGGGVGSSGSGPNQLTNGGFETGDLNGFVVDNAAFVTVVQSFTAPSSGRVYDPTQGQYFALLSGGAGANVYAVASETFDATAGMQLTGDAFYAANDYSPYDDDAEVLLLDSVGNTIATLFAASTASVGDFGNTPWTHFTYAIPANGTYTVRAQIRNTLDNAANSFVGLDNLYVG